MTYSHNSPTSQVLEHVQLYGYRPSQRLIACGRFLSERRDALETFRELAASAFESYTKSPWKPATGSRANHRNLTSAMIDSRDYLAAKRRNETQVMMPAGTKVAISGDADFSDYALIWSKLDQVLAKLFTH